jgi:hypothetical protein
VRLSVWVRLRAGKCPMRPAAWVLVVMQRVQVQPVWLASVPDTRTTRADRRCPGDRGRVF